MSIVLPERPANSGERFDLADYINPRALEALSGQRFDSTQTAFFLRDLTDIYSRTFDFKFPDLKARQILPVYTGVDPGAEVFAWRSYTRTGTAKVIESYAADMPEADVYAGENSSRVYSLGTSYMYSIQDLRKARMAGIPLETRKAFSARRAMEQAVEQIAFFGLTQIPGTGQVQALLNAPASQSSTDNLQAYGFTNFPGLAGATGFGTAGRTLNDWTNSATSVATIVDDFNKMFLSIIGQSEGVHTPDTVVFPLSIWKVLMAKPRSVTFTEDTILQYLQKINPWLKNVFWSLLLETAGFKQDGSTPGPRIMCFERNEENIQLVEPQPFEQLPPQMINLTFKIPCHQRIGGVRVSYPLAFTYLDGATG